MPSWRTRLIACALALVGIAAHLLLVDHFLPFAWLGSSDPITGVDFDTHAEQTWRVLEGLEGWGKAWVYDIQLQAGFPNGTIFDADNKLWELWTYALHRLGIPKESAYNSFVFLAHVLVMPWVFLAARCFGLTTIRALIAAALASLLWFFDSFAHWFWWIGTVSYMFAAYFHLVPLALFYRFTVTRSLWSIAATAVLLSIAHLLHPYSFFILAVPMLTAYASAFRSFSGREHAAVVAMALTVLLCNAYWLIVALRHWHYILNSAFYGQSHPGFVLADFFNVVLDASTTGYVGTRAAFRWLVLFMAFGALYLWRVERDRRQLLFAVSIVWMLALVYVAPVAVPPVRQLQPYRFVISAAFLSVIPAADLLVRLWHERRTVFAAPLVRIATIALGALALQHLISDVLYFVPGLLAEVPKIKEAPFPLAGTGFAPHFEYRHPKPTYFGKHVERWIDQHADEGRIAVPDWTGERYAWSTRAQILGGFVDLNIQHAQAHPVRWFQHGLPTAARLRRYIDVYAVQYFIVRFDDFGLSALPDVVSRYVAYPDALIYRSKQPVSFFAEGSGHVTAKTNRISVTDSDPARDVVLKYHWHEALVCRPDCRVVRSKLAEDEVGFVRVPAPHPSHFTVENSYRM